MQRARDVSSVHEPGERFNGPPPRYPVIGSKVPGESNSIRAPRASPMARPKSEPDVRETGLPDVIG